jgi:alpha-glucosidase
LRLQFALLLLAPAFTLHAQDERRVASPDGRVEFRLSIAPQAPGYLYRLAYEISIDRKPVIARSYLALDLLNQEPLLGENIGLLSAHMDRGSGYNSLVADYMQNGSIGRRIGIEARVYNEGVAFRYVIPRVTPLVDLPIADEATEFRFASGKQALGKIQKGALPFVTEVPSGGVVEIREVRAPGFPEMSLARRDQEALVTRLVPLANDPEVAFMGHTPFTGPWRVIVFGKTRDSLSGASWVGSLRP